MFNSVELLSIDRNGDIGSTTAQLGNTRDLDGLSIAPITEAKSNWKNFLLLGLGVLLLCNFLLQLGPADEASFASDVEQIDSVLI